MIRKILAAALIGVCAIAHAAGQYDGRVFGMKCDGSTNDAAAFAKVIAAANGDVVELPAGTCNLGSQIVIANKEVRIRGQGFSKTILAWTAAGGGFSYSTATEGHIFNLRDLTLQTNQAGGGTALDATWPVIASSVQRTALLQNVQLRGATLGTHYWTKGISLTNAWNGILDGINSIANPTPGFGGSAAIELLGDSNAVVITNFHLYHGDRCIKVAGTAEGTMIARGECVGAQVAVDMSTAGNEPGSSIIGIHGNTYNAGVILSRRIDMFIGGSFFYKQGGAASYTCISTMNASDRARIIGNECAIAASTGGTNKGIVVNAGNYNVINGNYIESMDVGISIENGSANNAVSGNPTKTVTTLIDGTTSGTIGNIVLPYQAELRSVNDAFTAEAPIVKFTKAAAGNQLIQIGGGYAGGSMANIVGTTNASLPGGAASLNGTIVLDTTNNWLVYYANGNRYKIIGVAF